MKKIFKILLIVALIVGVITGGYFIARNFGSNDYEEDDFPVEESSDSPYEEYIELEQGDVGDFKLDDKELKLSSSSANDFHSYLDSVDVEYEYDYGIDKALDLYSKNTKSNVKKHSHDIRVDGELDKDYFYKLVKKNNKAFLDSKREEHLDHMFKQYSSSQLREICDGLIDRMQEISEKNSNLDLDMVCCYLYNIVIVEKNSALDFAGFTMDNRFYINYDNMDTGAFAMDTDDIEKTTLYHESMHSFQFACDDIKGKNEDYLGVCHTYNEDDVKLNPLSWYWLIEGSAEMNMSKHLGVRYSTYKSFISYIESFNFVNILSNNEYKPLENICFQHDMNELYSLFGADTREKQEELIKLMYSIEIVINDDEEFFDLYEEQNDVDLITSKNGDNIKERVKYSIKDELMLDIAKLFYSNLADTVENGGVTLGDMYYLMRVFELDFNKHLSNAQIGNLVYFQELYDNYLEIQEELFGAIARDSGLDKQRLIDDFERYSVSTTKSVQQPSLDFMADKEKKYIDENIVSSIYRMDSPSIRGCQKIAKGYADRYSREGFLESVYPV